MSSLDKVVISVRSHVKTLDRLLLLKQTLHNFKQHGLNVVVFDDQSPIDIKKICDQYGFQYIKTTGTPNVFNGWFHQLEYHKNFKYNLICCDDIKLSSKFNEKLSKAIDLIDALPENSWGVIGFFAAFVWKIQTRKEQQFDDVFFKLDNDFLKKHYNPYAGLICNLYNQQLINILLNHLKDFYEPVFKEYEYQEDRYVIDMIIREKIDIYNTLMDYVQHTGANRSFDVNDFESSKRFVPCQYDSKFFVS